jgi:glycosyltransferase involved in cell wall biosynthesis
MMDTGANRILHLLKATGIAGAESHLLALLPALRPLGFESEVMLLEDPNQPQAELRRQLEDGGAAVRTLPIRWHLDPSLPARLSTALRARPFAILHAHLPHGEVYGELAMRDFPERPFVVSRHNDDRFRRWLPLRLAFAPSLRRADAIIAISGSVRRFLIEAEHAPQDKIVCIPYGIDAPGFSARAVAGAFRRELGVGAQPLAVFVGRLTAQKGVDTLLQAFARVEAAVPGATLALAGDGPQRRILERLTTSLGLRQVRFLGWRTDIPSLLSDADLLAMPSRWEGFGLTALEAMALAKPVVASRVSALPEIIADGETGLLVAPDDPESLAAAIIRMLRDRAAAIEFGRAGSELVRREFTVERMARQTADVYRRIQRA